MLCLYESGSCKIESSNLSNYSTITYPVSRLPSIKFAIFFNCALSVRIFENGHMCYVCVIHEQVSLHFRSSSVFRAGGDHRNSNTLEFRPLQPPPSNFEIQKKLNIVFRKCRREWSFKFSPVLHCFSRRSARKT